MTLRRLSDAILAPFEETHGPERRALPWWSIFTLQFWFAPWVAAWAGLSLTRVAVGGCILWLFHALEASHPVLWAHVAIWGLLFVASLAKNSRDLRLGFGSVLGRRGEDEQIRAAAVESTVAAQNVVNKVEAKLDSTL